MDKQATPRSAVARVLLMLPPELLDRIDRSVPRGKRNAAIVEAIRAYFDRQEGASR